MPALGSQNAALCGDFEHRISRLADNRNESERFSQGKARVSMIYVLLSGHHENYKVCVRFDLSPK